MEVQERERSIIVKHKRWADVWSIVSIILSIGLFMVASYAMDIANADIRERVAAYILLATIIVVVVVWQALAFALARLEIALTRS